MYIRFGDKMRVIVFGRETTIQKLNVSLSGEGVELVAVSNGLRKILALQKQDRFDLAIVDSLAEKAEAACHYIREFQDMPLVLMVHKRQADWERLQSLGADGYLPEDAKDAELAARLRAILRRFWPAGQVASSTPHL